MIRHTLKKLTRSPGQDEDEDDDGDEAGEFSFDFNLTAKADVNKKIIERAVELVQNDLKVRNLGFIFVH